MSSQAVPSETWAEVAGSHCSPREKATTTPERRLEARTRRPPTSASTSPEAVTRAPCPAGSRESCLRRSSAGTWSCTVTTLEEAGSAPVTAAAACSSTASAASVSVDSVKEAFKMVTVADSWTIETKSSVGRAEGSGVGRIVGSELGRGLGARLGAGLGRSVGCTLGHGVGSPVGASEGFREGGGVGSGVGSPVGAPVGIGDGGSVGAPVGEGLGGGLGAGLGEGVTTSHRT
mmetsp:Transcript_29478/g.66059  ORF Transcript_29478/g.66059 Transcript_29478/m.66059 type:complete len:232 (-) Transcript_29478:796-1491(-)